VRKALAGLNLPCEIVTGDAQGPAQRFAADLGIGVTANVRPDEKLYYLQQLSNTGGVVLMVVDGLNDTAALAAAHASIAPASALDASRSASDVVILKDSFEELPLLLTIAKLTRRLSKQNFAIAAIYNGIAIPIALAGFATPLAAALAMSASSITVLLNSQRIRFAK
jgi:Cu2+-exporting ATPase